jgi:hypothetical protein
MRNKNREVSAFAKSGIKNGNLWQNFIIAMPSFLALVLFEKWWDGVKELIRFEAWT